MYITFRWRTARNAESYHVRLQRYDSYGILQTVSEVPQCPDTAITLGVAVSNWQYLLTVYGANAEATGRTTTLTVRTADIPPPVPPSLQFPPDSALVPTAVILRWADSRQNTYDSGFELQAVTDTVGAGTYHMWSGHDPECDPAADISHSPSARHSSGGSGRRSKEDRATTRSGDASLSVRNSFSRLGSLPLSVVQKPFNCRLR